MALNIRDPDTEALAQAVAELTGENKTQAVNKALEQRLQRLQRRRAGHKIGEELAEIAQHCASLPVLDNRDAEDILGYNAQGLVV